MTSPSMFVLHVGVRIVILECFRVN